MSQYKLGKSVYKDYTTHCQVAQSGGGNEMSEAPSVMNHAETGGSYIYLP
ncbi:hypothetical protein PDE_01533 [Penicillium oxalicum 114-2]|uniref:Uncharacterized protein n=1 Tax=Penicillium oxalicum (strain 114-2 / CGMCC 5302) TaxID=933388 RepID=S7ZD34_PENO1|nr:hypothetical protein PDE_01533 [Penicillium oxalicum 114-2]